MKEYKRFTERVHSGFVSKLDCRIAYNKLRAIEDKIENGTLIELPCKVGDKVWYVNTFRKKPIICEDIICGYTINPKNKVQAIIDFHSVLEVDEICLTKAEAEAKLKELQNETIKS